MGISARSRTVLSQVVTLHYRTCGPVGSALVSKTKALSCSPATIRNIMMRLESSGHLSQPHTSAGRLPTDLGYRTYVNDIMLTPKHLNEMESVHLENIVRLAPSATGALKLIADYVHQRTNLITFSIPFRHRGFRLGHMHLERLNANQMLALWVARGGQTFQALLSIPEDRLSRNLMEKTANYFNNAFSGKNLIQIHRSLCSQLEDKGSAWDMLLTSATHVARALLEETSGLDLISFTGFSKLLEMPEFQDITKVRPLTRFIENQAPIKTLIERGLQEEQERVCFFIGGEIKDPELEGLAVVLGKFRNQEDRIGCIGALGPKRLPYLHSLQILRHAQNLMKAANY